MPTIVVIVSIVVAVAAVTGLIYVLVKNTTGPGQTLRAYYEAVAAGDCGKAYGYLSIPLHGAIPQDRYCAAVAGARGRAPTSITIQSVTGCGEPPARFARVTIVEHGSDASAQPVVWHLVRQSDEWAVASFPKLRRIVSSNPPPNHPRVPAACR